MRVLILTNMWPRPDWPTRGIFVARQAGDLADVGVEVDLLEIRGDRSRLAYLRAARDIVRLNFRERTYDLIHAHTGHCGLIACLQLKYPVVLTYHGYDLDAVIGPGLRARRRIERILFRRLSILVAATISQSMRGHSVLPASGLERNHVIPNGVDRRMFRPLPQEEARRKLGWPSMVPIVLFTGDPTLWIKRFALAEQAVTCASAVIGRIRLEVSDRADPDAMPLLMNAADALILTSRSEGSPSVVKEAMACSLPVVAVDVGDVRETTRGAALCHVCEPSPGALGAALVDVLQARPRRSDGRERTPDLDAASIASRLCSVFEQAMFQGPGPFGFLRGQRRSALRQGAPVDGND
jgi:teichuronic acid biosynthesis glycosyltransferase TuaC